jgi:hypothetical protein
MPGHCLQVLPFILQQTVCKAEALFREDKGATIRRNVVNHLPYDMTSDFVLETWVVTLWRVFAGQDRAQWRVLVHANKQSDYTKWGNTWANWVDVLAV